MSLLGNLVFFVFGGFLIAVQHLKLVPLALLPFGHVMRDSDSVAS